VGGRDKGGQKIFRPKGPVCGLARQQRPFSEDGKEEVNGRIARDASLFVIVAMVKVRTCGNRVFGANTKTDAPSQTHMRNDKRD
jgi:hypothetical protein